VGVLASFTFVTWALSTVSKSTRSTSWRVFWVSIWLEVFTWTTLETLGDTSVNGTLHATGDSGSSSVGGGIALDELDFSVFWVNNSGVTGSWFLTTLGIRTFAHSASGDTVSTSS